MDPEKAEHLRALKELTMAMNELHTRQMAAQTALAALIEEILTGVPPAAKPEPKPEPTPAPVPVPGPEGPVEPVDPYRNQVGIVGKAFSFAIPLGSRHADVDDLPPGLRFDSATRTISGTPTQADKRTLTITLSDGAGNVERKLVNLLILADETWMDPVGTPTMPLPAGPIDDRPIERPHGGDLTAVADVSKFSDNPFGYNRLQYRHPDYQDNWVFKSSEIAQRNADGFWNETPELLTRAGHNQHDALWYFGDGGTPPWGKPKSTDILFFEVTGACWEPIRTCFDVLTTELGAIGKNLKRTLPAWNSVPENGLIDNVATVKECHFNLEYAWFLEKGEGDPRNYWQGWTQEMRNRSFYNYAIDRPETFQDAYNRGGIDAIDAALHQKWRNIIGLSILIINRTSNMRAYYGDHKGIAEQHHIVNFYRDYSISDLFSSDVNDPGRFGEANESMNGGIVRIEGEVYDVTGNLRGLAGISHNYDYEWYVEMNGDVFDQYMQCRNGAYNINDWFHRMKPDLWRPYNYALHAMLTDYVKEKKGWPNYKVYWQTEPIYENSIVIPDRGWETHGAWVPWTLNDRACKIPLHPEVCASLVNNARMNLDGLFLWGAYRRQDLPGGRSENTHHALHQTGREGFQVALDRINSVEVFTPDKQKLLGNIRVWNEDGKNWIDGDPSRLVLHNGKGNNGQPARPLPLVTGVYSPTTKRELYQVYYPHSQRHEETPVKFKSPVDGQELTAMAKGWGSTLYVR